jgi:hypothetical protein
MEWIAKFGEQADAAIAALDAVKRSSFARFRVKG